MQLRWRPPLPPLVCQKKNSSDNFVNYKEEITKKKKKIFFEKFRSRVIQK